MNSTHLVVDQVNAAFSTFIDQLKTILGEYSQTTTAVKHNEHHAERVTLNVGGQFFSTTRATLLAERGSLFAAILSAAPESSSDKSGSDEKILTGECTEYFIDRPPLVFSHLLDYLRTGKLNQRDLTDWEKELLEDDIKYYGIHSLQEPYQVKFDEVPHSDDSVVVDNSRPNMSTLQRMRWGTLGRRYYLATRLPAPGCHRPCHWRVRAVKQNPTPWEGCGVGIGDATDPQLLTVVEVAFNTGWVFPFGGGGGFKFVNWDSESEERIVDFHFDPEKAQVTVTALGTSETLTLPHGKIYAPICEPNALGVLFSIETVSGE